MYTEAVELADLRIGYVVGERCTSDTSRTVRSGGGVYR